MGIILTGIVAAIGLAIVAGMILPEAATEPAWQAYSMDASVRVGEPGENLVGPNWSGDVGAEIEDTGPAE